MKLIGFRCELLSFIVSLLFDNNLYQQRPVVEGVVNCFHLSYLCSLITTENGPLYTLELL